MKYTHFLWAPSIAAALLFGGCKEDAGIDPPDSSIECAKDSDCPAVAEAECSTFVACTAGKCSYAFEPDGKVIAAQTAGDCSQRVCDGKGGARLQAHDADIEDDGLPCSLDTCEGGLPKHTPQQSIPCYSGPIGTAGTGPCKQGIQLCGAGFKPIGGCEGEVVPQPESCLTPEDENCDGAINDEGEGCVCSPDAVSPCYEGPEATSGVGICAAGTCTCNGAGTGCASACDGQVLPAKESCATPEDDDCDGSPLNGCAWVKASTTVGNPDLNRVTSIATDAAGNLYVAGATYRFGNTIDLGGGPLTPPDHGTNHAAFVVKLAPDGTHLWSKLLPCAGPNTEPRRPRLAVAGGNVALAYTVGLFCDFGSGSQSVTTGIAFIQLNPSTGAFVSSAVIGDSSSTQVYALGAGSGGFYLAGYQDGVGTVGGVALSSQPFVAKVVGSSVAWAKGLALSSSNGNEDRARALAVLPDDAVAFAGNVTKSTIDLGAGFVGDAAALENHYFGVLEPDGSPRWGKVHSSTSGCCSSSSPSALAVAPSGDVIAMGRAFTSLQFGAVAISISDGYLASLAAADGAVSWAKPLDADSSGAHLNSLSVDAAGYIGIGAYLNSTDNLGGADVAQNGIYIAMLDGAGTHLWTKLLPLFVGIPGSPFVAPAMDTGIFFTGLINGPQTFDGTTVGQNKYEAVFGRLAL